MSRLARISIDGFVCAAVIFTLAGIATVPQYYPVEVDTTRLALRAAVELQTRFHQTHGRDPHTLVELRSIDPSDAVVSELMEGQLRGGVIRDAWGTPLVFVPAGTDPAPNPRRPYPYFFSAGPDAQADTVEDNVYSDSQ